MTKNSMALYKTLRSWGYTAKGCWIVAQLHNDGNEVRLLVDVKQVACRDIFGNPVELPEEFAQRIILETRAQEFSKRILGAKRDGVLLPKEARLLLEQFATTRRLNRRSAPRYRPAMDASVRPEHLARTS